MFSRGSRSPGRHSRDHPARRGQRLDRPTPAAGATPAAPVPAAAPAAGAVPGGPYDASQAPQGVPRLDLGSLQIRLVPGVEARVPANRDGVVHQVYLVHTGSSLQLGVFAAPRSEPIWDEVRAEIRESLATGGAEVAELAGEHGVELWARIRTDDGPKELRFVGVDGPRWMVRGVYRGPAASGGAGAGELAGCLRGLVVNRGEEARPVKEPLPLRLASELAVPEPHPAAAGGAGTGPANGAPAPRRPSPRHDRPGGGLGSEPGGQ